MTTIEPNQLSNTNGGCAPVCVPACPVPVPMPAYRMAYPAAYPAAYGFARPHAWGYGYGGYAAPAAGWWGGAPMARRAWW